MIQLKHLNKNKEERATAAVELPLVASLKGMLELGINTLPINVGVSFVHPHDRYVKKVGAEVAVKKMKFHNAELKYVTMRLTRELNMRIVFHFHVVVEGPLSMDHKFMDLAVSYLPDSERSRIEFLELL